MAMQKPSITSLDVQPSYSSMKSYLTVHPIGPVVLNGVFTIIFWMLVALAIHVVFTRIAPISKQDSSSEAFHACKWMLDPSTYPADAHGKHQISEEACGVAP